MNSVFEAVLGSWNFAPFPLLALVLAAAVYLRGWSRLHRQLPERFTSARCVSFLSGLTVVGFAVVSPLDAFANLLLQVHMVQHLLLTMVAPPLLLLGSPYLPMLCGLPRVVTRDVLGPFLAAPELRRWGHRLTHPLFTGAVFILSNLAWHHPVLYELALRSRGWHELEHLFFLGTALLFWFPVIQPWPSRPIWPRWAMIPYLLVADLQNTALGGFFSFYDRVIYPTYAVAPRLWSLTPLADQQAAGAIMWVPGSMAFLIPVVLIVVKVLSGSRGVRPSEVARRTRPSPQRIRTLPSSDRAEAWDLLSVPRLGAVLRSALTRRVVQTGLLLLAALVVWDGWWGTPISSLNFAGILPWMGWRGLLVIGLLVAGNMFCYSCPMMWVRDWGRRILPGRLTWPRALRSKWLAVVLLALFFWASEAFQWWDRPAATASLVVAYFVAAVVIDGLFKGASFCKYVCPIGQFNFAQSLVSPLEVKVKDAETCRSCTTHDCLKGNATQRGCELELFLPRKAGNLECTFCLDCVRACPQGNVGVLMVFPARDATEDRNRSSIGRYKRRPDWAVLVAVVAAAAWAGSAVMVAPVVQWLVAVQRSWGLSDSWLPITLFYLVVGGVVLGGLALGGELSRRMQSGQRTSWREWTPEFVYAIAPIGLAVWVAHYGFHLLVGVPLIGPALGRLAWDTGVPLGTGLITLPLAWREGFPTVQLLILDAGYLLSLWMSWRIAQRKATERTRRLGIWAPWAGLWTLGYGAAFWIFLQPMQMRGLPGQAW